MGKILALDFGLKRTGVAISDELQLFSFGLETVDSKELMSFLEKKVPAEKIEIIVLGMPKRLNNEDAHITENVRLLKKALEEKFPLVKIDLMDERFTSKMASATILASGVNKKKRQEKSLVDKVSATIILQSYLEGRSNK